MNYTLGESSIWLIWRLGVMTLTSRNWHKISKTSNLINVSLWGYSKETKRYNLFYLEKHKVFVTHFGVSLEGEFILKMTSTRKIKLDEVMIQQDITNVGPNYTPHDVVKNCEEVTPLSMEQCRLPQNT